MPRHKYTATVGDNLDNAKREFGKNLHNFRIERGFSQSDLARAAAKYMADRKFGRDLIGPYERGVRLPSPMHLSALARALGREPRDLVPFQGVPAVETDRTTLLELKDIGEGRAWIRINKSVPMDVATEVLRLVNAPVKKPS